MSEFNGLTIDLESNEVVIDGYNSAFENTPYAGKDFEIVVEPVTHREYDRIKKKFTNRKNNTDEVKLERELFMKQVKGWKGIKTPDGKDLECTDEVKEIIVEKIFFFTRAVNIACLNARAEISEEEGKNLDKSGNGV